jgi:hypothetical protein
MAIAKNKNLRRGVAYWGVVIYLLGFAALALVFLHYYLLPAYRASQHADIHARRQIGAVSALMLSVFLIYLLCGVILTFRVGRFFFPRPGSKRVTTTYIDAWKEAGRRLNENAKDDDESDENP